MALPSVPELVRLFDDEELAREVHAAEAIASWPSLRVLAVLCEASEASTGKASTGKASTGKATTGKATTGDIARAVNMDMGEVRDHLEALAELGVVAESDGAWEVVSEQARLEVKMDGELYVSHAVGAAGDEATAGSPETDEQQTEGLLTRLKQRLPGSL